MFVGDGVVGLLLRQVPLALQQQRNYSIAQSQYSSSANENTRSVSTIPHAHASPHSFASAYFVKSIFLVAVKLPALSV
jgi:hypothetical protein